MPPEIGFRLPLRPGASGDGVPPALPAEIRDDSGRVPEIRRQGAFVKRLSQASSTASRRKLTGRNPSLQEIMADFGSFIQPS